VRRIVLPALLAASLCLAAAAEGIYKWVDEKGVTHYSESPPDEASGKKATKVDIKASGPADAGKPYDWKAKELDSRTQSVQKNQEERAKAEAEAKATSERKQMCQQAMRQVSFYQQQVPVYTLNDKGERVYVEDDDRAKKIEDAQARMRQYCD